MLTLEAGTVAQAWLENISDESQFLPLTGNKVRFNTPFTDPFGDEISLLIESFEDGGYLVTDQGYTIWNLNVRGINTKDKNSTRSKIIASILCVDDVTLSRNNAIQKKSNRSSLAQTINDVLEAVLKVSDLAFSNKANTKSIFLDDVVNYLQKNKESYSFETGMFVKGKTKLIYNLDFVFHPTVRQSKWTKLYSSLNRGVVEMVLGIWMDTKEYREQTVMANQPTFNIIVKTLSGTNIDYVDSLKQHNINVIPFDKKNEIAKNFAIPSNS